MQGGYFKWDSNSTCPTLRNINLEVKCGTLVAIVGIVGSGKSALLGCILGELEKVVGQVRTCRIPSDIAYLFAVVIILYSSYMPMDHCVMLSKQIMILQLSQ